MKRLRDRKGSKKQVGILEDWNGEIEAFSAEWGHYWTPSQGQVKVPNFEFSVELRLSDTGYRDTITLESIDGKHKFQMYPCDFQELVFLSRSGNGNNVFYMVDQYNFAFGGEFFFDFSGADITIKPVKV